MTAEDIIRKLATLDLRESGGHGEGYVCSFCGARQGETHDEKCLYRCAVEWVEEQKLATVTDITGTALSAQMLADVNSSCDLLLKHANRTYRFTVVRMGNFFRIFAPDWIVSKVRPVINALLKEKPGLFLSGVDEALTIGEIRVSIQNNTMTANEILAILRILQPCL